MAIPWTSLLAAAPALAESARRLLAETRDRRGSATSDVTALAERVAALEQRDRETADLIERLTTQNAALAAAVHALAFRGRALTILAGVAIALAVAATLVALAS
jgi:hypothetical protein